METFEVKTDWMDETCIREVNSRCAYDEFAGNENEPVVRLYHKTYLFKVADCLEMHEDYVRTSMLKNFLGWFERLVVFCTITGDKMPSFLDIEGLPYVIGDEEDMTDFPELFRTHGPLPSGESIHRAIRSSCPSSLNPIFLRRVPWTVDAGRQCPHCGAKDTHLDEDFRSLVRGRFSFGFVPGLGISREVLFREFPSRWNRVPKPSTYPGFGELLPLGEGDQYKPGDPEWRPDPEVTDPKWDLNADKLNKATREFTKLVDETREGLTGLGPEPEGQV